MLTGGEVVEMDFDIVDNILDRLTMAGSSAIIDIYGNRKILDKNNLVIENTRTLAFPLPRK